MSMIDVPDLGDPALDPPLSIRVHPDDDPRDPKARRVVKSDDQDDDEHWHLVTGLNEAWGSEFYRRDEFVATWPRQHWLVAAAVFGHAVHADPRAGQPADRPAAALDGSDVAGTPFRMGEPEFLRITLDDGPELSTIQWAWECEPIPGPPDGLRLTYVPGPQEWTMTLDGAVGEFGRKHSAKFTARGQSYRGTAEVESQTEHPNGAVQTTLVVHDVEESR